jgi:hypothetical protein
VSARTRSTDAPPPAIDGRPAPAPPAWVDPALRVAGGVIAVWGAFLLAVLGEFLTPLRIGSTLVPIALLIAISGPAVVMWFGYETTGHKLGALLPGLVWVAAVVPAVDRTSEGDFVLTQQWVAILYLFLSPIAAAVAGYRLLAPRRL